MEARAHAAEERTGLVCFLLAGQEYAADIQVVSESLTPRPITKVALTPSWLAGIINLRGDVVAILNLGVFLGLPQDAPSANSRIIIAKHEGRRAGFLCDQLCDVRRHDLSNLQPPPSTLKDSAAMMLSGVLTLEDGHAVRILDLEALFESRELATFRRGESA